MLSEDTKATIPHQLLILNLIIFNIYMPIASLLNHLERSLLPIAFICSLLTITFIGFKAKVVTQTPLINAQWQIVWRRCRVLLIAYSLSISIELLSSLMASMQSDPKLAQITMIAFSRIAIIPTLLVVTPLLIMSTIAITKIRRGTAQAV